MIYVIWEENARQRFDQISIDTFFSVISWLVWPIYSWCGSRRDGERVGEGSRLGGTRHGGIRAKARLLWINHSSHTFLRFRETYRDYFFFTKITIICRRNLYWSERLMLSVFIGRTRFILVFIVIHKYFNIIYL